LSRICRWCRRFITQKRPSRRPARSS